MRTIKLIAIMLAAVVLFMSAPAWAKPIWRGVIESIQATLGGTTVPCRELFERHRQTEWILNEILRLNELIVREIELPSSRRSERRINRWTREQRELRLRLDSEIPEEFRRRDQRVQYNFEAPRLADEVARAGDWNPLPGLRAIERLEVHAIRTGQLELEVAKPGNPAFDSRGNEIPTFYKLERDLIGRETLTIRFHRYLSRADVCTSDLSMELEIKRLVTVDLPGGGTQLFTGDSSLKFSGVKLQ